MKKIARILQLAKEEGGKVFVVDENGNPELVILSMKEYENLKHGLQYDRLSEKLAEITEQTEMLNNQITEIQKEEVDDPETKIELPGEKSDFEIAEENLYIEPIEE